MARHDLQVYIIVYLILDILSIILSGILSVWIRFNPYFFRDILLNNNPNTNYYAILLLIVPIFIFVNFLLKLYKTNLDRDYYGEVGKIVLSNLLSALILMSFTFVTKEGLIYSRLVLFIFILANILLSILIRGLYRYYINIRFKKGYIQKRFAIVGTGKLAEIYINSVKNYLQQGYKLEGIILTEQNEEQKGYLGYTVLGCIDDIIELNKKYLFDEIIIAIHFSETPMLKELIKICDSEGIRIKIIPAYYEFLKVSTSIDDINGLPLLVVRGIPLDMVSNRFIKRSFDIIFSLLVIIFLSPVLIIVAIGVKTTSKGPVLFKQERVGLNNNVFNVLKFRSMRLQDPSETNVLWTKSSDPRKTKFGSFIRKTSLDELPQFFNVLKGDMSVVGPRPERPYWVNEFKNKIPEYMLRHYVKSGITGWAQINGWRGDTSIEERIKCDNFYIQNWSIWLDIKICLLTLPKTFSDKNAY